MATTSIPLYSMSGDLITTFTSDELEFCSVSTLVEDMEQDECRGVPGARHHASYHKIFVERYCLIIGERILQGHEDVLTCINDPTSAGKHFMLYKKPVSPRTVADKIREIQIVEVTVIHRNIINKIIFQSTPTRIYNGKTIIEV